MKCILESPEEPYFIEYRGDWNLVFLNNDYVQRAAREFMEQNNIVDLSIVYSKWYEFIYGSIPNNWLKMHGYPMRRRLSNAYKRNR